MLIPRNRIMHENHRRRMPIKILTSVHVCYGTTDLHSLRSCITKESYYLLEFLCTTNRAITVCYKQTFCPRTWNQLGMFSADNLPFDLSMHVPTYANVDLHEKIGLRDSIVPKKEYNVADIYIDFKILCYGSR